MNENYSNISVTVTKCCYLPSTHIVFRIQNSYSSLHLKSFFAHPNKMIFFLHEFTMLCDIFTFGDGIIYRLGSGCYFAAVFKMIIHFFIVLQ